MGEFGEFQSAFRVDGLGPYELIFTLVAGRVLLAWLPPGEIGSHSLRGLPMTVTVSLVLGILAVFTLVLIPLLFMWYGKIVTGRRAQLEAFNRRLAKRLTAKPPARTRSAKPDPKKDA